MQALTGTLVEAEGELFEAEGCLKAMEIEIKNMQKNSFNEVLARCRDDYESAFRVVEKLKVLAKSASIRGGANFRNWSVQQTAKESHNAPLSELERSKMILNETEQIGSIILTDLMGNRLSLEGAKDKVGSTKKSTIEAGEVLHEMSDTIDAKSSFLIFLTIILFIFIIVITYIGIIQKKLQN